MSASVAAVTPRRVITTYLVAEMLFTLSLSLIWSVNTLFLLDAGLDIFEVMLVNAAFTAGQVVFEVPTGVVADTIGRRASYLLAIGTLFASTLLYVATYRMGWGIGVFALASVILGFGFTCYTGAVQAWLVDALDATGFDLPKERVFAAGQMVFSGAMLVGTLGGGILGQLDLALPYYVRSGLLVGAFIFVFATVRDLGFSPRPLRTSRFVSETRAILTGGVRFGWRHPVIRPLLYVSLVAGVFEFYGFYSWQPYFLQLLDRDLIWVAGVVTAGFALAGIVGNAMVRRIMGEGERRRDPASVLAVCGVLYAATTAGVGLVGLLTAPAARGLGPFLVAAGLYVSSGVVFGVELPVRQGYLNEFIPSGQRATVLSLDSFFLDAGGAVGQPGLGWLSRAFSIPVVWVLSGGLLSLVPPLYLRAASAARAGTAEGTSEAAD